VIADIALLHCIAIDRIVEALDREAYCIPPRSLEDESSDSEALIASQDEDDPDLTAK
jgi:hypothetical protein